MNGFSTLARLPSHEIYRSNPMSGPGLFPFGFLLWNTFSNCLTSFSQTTSAWNTVIFLINQRHMELWSCCPERFQTFELSVEKVTSVERLAHFFPCRSQAHLICLHLGGQNEPSYRFCFCLPYYFMNSTVAVLT